MKNNLALEEKNYINKLIMPKIKTKSGTKKRFKVTATGKILMFASGKRHNLSKRTKTMKRSSRGPTLMSKQDTKIVKKYINAKLR
jgi:large subunit ribosomal protein L35